jgi:Rrf2 family protein
MLQLTKRTEYGLIALVHLADHVGAFVSAREIGESYPVPRRLVAEVLKDLCRAGLVESQRGATGGYSLALSPESISVGRVVQTLEGAPTLTGCETLGAWSDGSCDVTPVCPIRSPISRLRSGIWDLMQGTTLADLAAASSPDASTDHNGANHHTTDHTGAAFAAGPERPSPSNR